MVIVKFINQYEDSIIKNTSNKYFTHSSFMIAITFCVAYFVNTFLYYENEASH